MSSYYTTAQLEAMRKERIRKEMDESIRKLKDQMMINHSGAQADKGSSVVMTVFVEDESIEGMAASAGVSGSSLRAAKGNLLEKRDGLDFSTILLSQQKKPSKLEQELHDWIIKLNDRLVISQKDELDKARVNAELNQILESNNTDIEDKLRLVKMRVSAYLSGAVRLSDIDKEEITSNYYEYCALCNLLQVNPTEHTPYRVKTEIARMKSVLEKRKQDEYIMEVIEEAMADIGCHVKDDAVLDHTEGQVYSVDGHPLCDVFVGADGSGIMFEPIGESRDVSIEKQRRIAESANKICSLYTKLEEKAAEKGVILKRIYMEPTQIEQMCVQSDISERKERKKQRKNTSQNLRTFKMED